MGLFFLIYISASSLFITCFLIPSGKKDQSSLNSHGMDRIVHSWSCSMLPVTIQVEGTLISHPIEHHIDPLN